MTGINLLGYKSCRLRGSVKTCLVSRDVHMQTARILESVVYVRKLGTVAPQAAVGDKNNYVMNCIIHVIIDR